MKNRRSTVPYFLMSAAFFLLLLAGTTNARPISCGGHTPGQLETELDRAIDNKPTPGNAQWWVVCLDPDFGGWRLNSSQNLPVVSAAIGLYRKPNSNLPNSQISFLDWWVKYLATQIGQQPAPANTPNLRYFKGTELFSNTYDASVVTSIVAVRYWAYKNQGNTQIDQTKINQLIDFSQKYLRANWAIYGMAAGSGPATKYELPGRTPTSRNPPRPDTEYNPNSPLRDNGALRFSGNFLALAGTRSKLGHWAADEKLTLFARAIEITPQNNNELFNQKVILAKLQAYWPGNPAGENLYGLTWDNREKIKALIMDQLINNQFAANYFLPWLIDIDPVSGKTRVDIRTAMNYRIIGWPGFRTSSMEMNMNGTNMFGISYNANTQTATFLFPWGDANNAGRVNGWCRLEAPPFAGAEALLRANNTKNPPLEVTMNLPGAQPSFHLVLSPNAPAQFDTSSPASWPPLSPKKTDLSVASPIFTDADGSYKPWVVDRVPAGAVTAGDYENWNWTTDPEPAISGQVHQSALVTGTHQHYFYGATESLVIDAGDRLYAYVYLDPVNPPSEVMLQWSGSDGSWEHRAYWGTDQINWGANGTNSRRYIGPLPPFGAWVMLEVPASMIGMEGRALTGMAFTLFSGRASWDEAGKVIQGGPSTNLALGKVANQSTTAFNGFPSIAVDGNTNGNANYTHTDNNYQAWWQLDLGSNYSIDQIAIWNRTNFCCPERLSNFYVFVSGTPFISTDLNTTLNQPEVSAYYVSGTASSPTAVAIVRPGRYVRVQLTGTNYLSLAEVQVIGQPDSFSPPPTPPAASVAWVMPAEYSWGPPGTMTAAGFAINGTGGVQLVWRDETAGTGWTTVLYQPPPSADGTWSNTLQTSNWCHTYRVYVNYAGVRSADFVYTGAGYCSQSAAWIHPQASAGFGSSGSLIEAGTARSLSRGYQVSLPYRDITAGTGWVQAGYAPVPYANGNWFNSIDDANPARKYDVQVKYNVITSRTCAYQGTTPFPALRNGL